MNIQLISVVSKLLTSKIERFEKIVYNGATLGHSLIEKEDQKNKYKLTKIDKIR